MDEFAEKIKTLSKRVLQISEVQTNEEAAKTSAIMPFFQALGYDVFDPTEFMPEFTADVGIKKGEKVDYAILKDGAPLILIECKAFYDDLSKRDSQLFRYFGTTSAKFGILTNGKIYKFYTDLDEQNKMDKKPFFTFDLADLKDSRIVELKKFRKAGFDVEQIFDSASVLRYKSEIRRILTAELDNPSDEFTVFFLNGFYDGRKTQNVIDKFKGIVKTTLNQFINEKINDKLQSALDDSKEDQQNTAIEEKEAESAVEEDVPKIETTPEEIEGYVRIKLLLSEVVSADRLFYRDNLSYFNIIVDNSIRKWVCRLGLNGTNKWIQLHDDEQNTYKIDTFDDLQKYKKEIIDVVNKYID
ncbi:type I restriction endonuclease [Sporolactobacillus sp. STSJ-5]|uniref:type I restriction endonuclease n=1 Tax=Sporolactobacillus sp. STSJ-5 TaxID=2965076 RepID=UPI0021028DC0|nr:type I restriction endonuclease [Sporolactobacillus sp. STSJ-5]MCQ2010585.1 type I restriction endonuclease [Sporolactobacillus sp. STSJ-5]